MRFLTIIFILLLTLLVSVIPAQAQPMPVVHIVFFYNPDCDNCQQVISKDLPPLQARFGPQLEILQINTSKPEGLQLYQAMYRHFKLSDDRLGTPAIVIGKSVLVGSDEIPAGLPGLIEEGLVKGGVGWPEIPGLDLYIASAAITNPYPNPQVYP